jgi:hypothetical protein
MYVPEVKTADFPERQYAFGTKGREIRATDRIEGVSSQT